MMRVGTGVMPFLAVMFLFVGFAHASTLEECVARFGKNSRPATADDAVVKNGQIKAGECYNPSTPGIKQSSEEAKQYLNTLPKRPLSNCAPPTQENINKLNDAFAICAARFFQEYTKRYGAVYITSAFRDGQPGTAANGSGQSANQCAGGVNGSNHTRGVAMDVNPAHDGMYAQLWHFARTNPQFGVCFPHLGSDRPHIILAGIDGSEGAKCAAQGVTRPCDGSGYDPNSIRSSAPDSLSPTARFANTIRQALGMQPAQQAYPAQQAFPSQPLAQSQSPLGSFNTLPTPLVNNSPIGTGVLATTSSVADRLEELAFGNRATTTQSATSVPLVINPNDVGGVVSHVQNNQQTGVASIGGGITQSTFVWNDPGFQGQSTVPQSTFQATLATLKTALLWLLDYLQPFRSRTQQSGEVLE